MSKSLRNFIITIISSLILSSIFAAAKSIIDVARIEEKVSFQKETLQEIKSDVKELKFFLLKSRK